MTYFNHCQTLEEVKALYRVLAKDNHPDKGGSVPVMQAINTEYAFISAQILKGSKLSSEEAEKEIRFSEEYRSVIESIAHLPGIIIELVGMWIWVTGDTKPVRQHLSEARFHFAKKKIAWYYHSEDYKIKRGGKKSLEEIKDKYGSRIIRTQQKQWIY